MYYAMEFVKQDYGNYVSVRAVRTQVSQSGEGFVKQAGIKTPIWSKLG